MNSLTSTITGLKNGDIATVPSYTISPTYSGAAGVYAIIPGALTFAKAGNYSITYTNGVLCVNPKGNGAKKLRPSLDCVEEVPGGTGASRFIAHFSCINDNATPVYVPWGTDNNLSSATGLFDGSTLPKLFPPGTIYFHIPFDGTKLVWELRTYDTNKKTSTATNASSTSSRCPGITMARPEAETPPAGVKLTRAYPNPGHNSIVIESARDLKKDKTAVIFDAQGKTYVARIRKTTGANALELDISSLKPGVYFVRLNVEKGYETIRFEKL
jgi:hypothetical protein